MIKGLVDKVEGKIDPGKFVFYFLAKKDLKGKEEGEIIKYKKTGNKIVVEVDVNDVVYKRFEIVKDKFLDNYSIYYKGCFLK